MSEPLYACPMTWSQAERCPAGFTRYSYDITHSTYSAQGGLGNSQSLTVQGCASLCTSSSSCFAFEFNAVPGSTHEPCYMQAAPTAGMTNALAAGWLACVKMTPSPTPLPTSTPTPSPTPPTLSPTTAPTANTRDLWIASLGSYTSQSCTATDMNSYSGETWRQMNA